MALRQAACSTSMLLAPLLRALFNLINAHFLTYTVYHCMDSTNTAKQADNVLLPPNSRDVCTTTYARAACFDAGYCNNTKEIWSFKKEQVLVICKSSRVLEVIYNRESIGSTARIGCTFIQHVQCHQKTPERPVRLLSDSSSRSDDFRSHLGDLHGDVMVRRAENGLLQEQQIVTDFPELALTTDLSIADHGPKAVQRRSDPAITIMSARARAAPQYHLQ
ncbi:hypothetical protein SNOG_02974 [Parastagonospora nodorum SN15]|uniref:Uncharacterized protein n=1 Tax=Phaeosphaeria nodorum (strain SN15 / ATCC MYA-4574 / FGSC 10173) TaxID=321614 RepID=Q0UZ40_PHANO|nr:hypothetical protein SNOG_02974 [Parastagonospora nodorum SN15]EAT89705.1 hypothetical protein SNOG_02974 [Parastagonospora nodorum SN15]